MHPSRRKSIQALQRALTRDVTPDGAFEPITVNRHDGTRSPGRVVVA